MNFFEAQAKARNQTKNLVFLFGLAVLSLIVLTNILVMVVFGYIGFEEQSLTIGYIVNQFNWRVFVVIGVAVLLFILIASLYKASTLSGGGKVVALSLGGSLVTHGNDNLQYKVLLNVVEEMAIASGTPIPEVYVLQKESGINAFAAGYTLDDAVIGVTQGALDCFTREELQGVIAHEFSHVIHGDMRLNMKLIAVLHGILLIGMAGYYIMRMSGGNSRSKKGNQIVFLGLGLVVIGYGGTFFGNIIKASVSRQREYLADASAVQFTRNNRGIADALKKIGGYTAGSKLETTEAQSVSHAFFSNALSNKLSSFLATHPPLSKRIQQLEPNWKGNFEATSALNQSELKDYASRVNQFATSSSVDSISVSREVENSKTSNEFANSVGRLEQAQLDTAKAYLANMPQKLVTAVHSVTGAQAYVYALLLNESTIQNVNPYVAEKQDHYLLAHLPSDIYRYINSIADQVSTLDIEYRLPLLEIALPQLRQIPSLRFEAMLQQIEYLVFADNQLSLFEWSIANIVGTYLKTEFETAAQRQVKYHSIHTIQIHVESIVSVIVNEFCHANDIEQILAKANSILGTKHFSNKVSDIEPIEDFALAISELQYLSFDLKEKVLQLCVFAVTLDKVYTPREHETIRALAGCLGCPLPIALCKERP